MSARGAMYRQKSGRAIRSLESVGREEMLSSAVLLRRLLVGSACLTDVHLGSGSRRA